MAIRPSTMSRLRCRTRRMSIAVEPVTTPNVAAWWIRSATLALQTSFLLGRQLMLGHEPPTYRRSTTAARRPDLARCQDRSLPPAPLPRTRSSYRWVLTSLILPAGWRRSGRRSPAGGSRAPSVPARRCSSSRMWSWACGVSRRRRLRTWSPSELAEERHQIRFLLLGQLQPQDQVEELDGVLQRQAAAVVHVRRAVLDPAQREALDRAVARLVLQEALHVQVVHLVVEVGRRRMAGRALRLAEEQLLAAQLALGRLRRVETAERRQLGRGREVEHVLHLRHVRHLDPIQDVHPLLDGVNLVAVEIRRPLLELGEVLDRAEAPLRPVNLLVEHAAQAHRVQAYAPLLGSGIRIDVELPAGVPVDVTVEAGHAQAGLGGLAVVGRIELLLRERRQQEA